jgi:hypothetical protein
MSAGPRTPPPKPSRRRYWSPVLVIHARDDHHVPLDFALAAVARHPDWAITVLDRGGHHAHVTESGLWLEAEVPFPEHLP